MCGLAGLAVIGGELPVESDGLLRRMSRAVGHRGPDGERLLRDGPVALAFRRLALVDPAGGDQPLFSTDESAVLIANGEVYNHHDLRAGPLAGVAMRTRSDCEVLVHLYARDGLRFLAEVCGMYAVVLWDRRRNRLVLARDRFGIKPLYYTRVGDTVLFASEIKALFEHPGCPRDLDWEGALAEQSMNLAPYLTHEPVTSWFRHIEIVPAGSIVTIDLATGRTERHEYWRLSDFDGDSGATDAELIDAYRDLLGRSVADCATADTELGLFLSGGVDSASVAAFAARAGREIHTFSVLNAGTFANGDAEFGHRVAATLGLPNHQLLFDTALTPGVAEWRQLLWLLETPLCNAEQYYKYELYRYAKRVRPELRGMLLGQASDEYNGGYATVFGGDDWASFETGVLQLARAAALHDMPALSGWWSHADGPLLSDEPLRQRAARLLTDPYAAYVAWKHRTIQQYNCWHEDRTAAGNGVEARVPFLDHRIVELLATIPASRRAGLLWDKRILRDAVRGLLPDVMADRPKVSFFYGDGARFTHRSLVRMLAQDGDALLEEALAAPGAERFYRKDALRRTLRRLEGEAEPFDVEFLLRLVNLGLLDQLVRGVPVVPLAAERYEIRRPVAVGDWSREADDLHDVVHRPPRPGLGDVVAFGDDVLLLTPTQDPDTAYLAVGGQFRYVVARRRSPAWYALLCSVDGRRTLEELLDATGVRLAEVAGPLRDAVTAGLLLTTPAPAMVG